MQKEKWGKAYWIDLAERVGSTFLVVFIPLYAATPNAVHLDWLNDLEVSATAAGLSLLKGVATNLVRKGDPTASLVGVTSDKK